MLSAVLTMAMLGPRLGASPEESISHAAAATQNGATLTILAAPVEIARSGLDEFTAPSQGELLQVGDVVRTGPGGIGLITFFDGSESQLGLDSQLQIERLDATPAIHIALLQTAGVTTNHVVPVKPGGSFQTDTPAAVAMVRGTSYVVAVTGLSMIRPAASPQQATAQATSAASADGVALSVDPPPTLDPDAPIGDTAQADAAAGTDAAEAANMANAPDVSIASDGEDAIDIAALEDNATLEAPQSPADHVAAAAGQSRALESADPACRGNDKPQCLTTVVLLADPDGRVGRVVVEPRAALAAVELTRPGDLGATSSRSVARGQLSASAVQQLQRRTQNLRDTLGAAATAAEVQLVVKTIEPLVEPYASQAVAPDAVQPVAPGTEVNASTPAPGPSPTPELVAMLVTSPATEAPIDAPSAKPAADPQTLATPRNVNDPAAAVATTTPADTVPVKPENTAVPRGSVAPATPGSIAPATSGSVPPATPGSIAPAGALSVPPAAPETEARGSVKPPSVGVTPAAAPAVTTLAETPTPSSVATPAPAPVTTTAPAGSQPLAIATATPATSAPNISPVPPITNSVPPSPSPTPRVS